jgi:hypothetical protein
MSDDKGSWIERFTRSANEPPAEPNDPKSSRERSAAVVDRARRTTEAARALSDATLDASRKKTLRLRQERLAKEAREGTTEIDKKTKRRRP